MNIKFNETHKKIINNNRDKKIKPKIGYETW